MSDTSTPAIMADRLRHAWREALGREPEPGSDFFGSGGDSLLIARMVSRLRREGVAVGPKDVLLGRTFDGILQRLRPAPDARAGLPLADAGTAPLLPTQARWVANRFAEPDHFNLGWIFQLDERPEPGGIAEALRRLADRHEALRTAYDLASATARVLPEVPGEPLTVLEVEEAEAGSALAAQQRGHDLAKGVVLSAAWVPGPRLLQVIVHHLTLDGYSLAVLADDLEELLLDGRAGEPPAVQPRQHAAAVQRWLDGPQAAEAEAAWARLPWDRVSPVPVEKTGPATLPTMTTVSGTLEEAPAGADALLTAAAATAVMERFDLPALSVDAYHHARDEFGADLTRTIGYLQATYPIVFRAGDAATWWERAQEDLRRLPAQRFSFDALRFTGGRKALGDLPSSLVRMNFRGQFARLNERRSSRLRPAAQPPRGMRSPAQTEPYRLMLEGDVIDDALTFTIKFSTDHYAVSTIEGLVQRTLELLSGRAR
ncbi:condensation domain-containing protein [Thermoactinospora rubra]|uniref:condensation domain-containing protein n=1 Tax=Thermoactinospora rubra TaxID=1088767 RepID=UPI000A0F8514|nr:condensation domain-containing protein [Thermoactinospora rubra]